MSKKPFYITTPIYYPSGNPHIGHCYTTVACDSIARFKRMQGYDVMFLTGTDEHGLKIEQKAVEKGVTPKEFVDVIVDRFKSLWKYMNVDYDRFIRTTDDYHVEAVQKIFKALYDKGYIYKGEYSGKYCTPCESFWTDSQLDENGCCPECHRPVAMAKEEAYFFKMSPFAECIEKLLTETDYLRPKTRATELVNNFIKPGLEDLCVSRTTFKWGIPVTFDEDHVVYVWIDALSNYITAMGYMNGVYDDMDKFWPADVHMVAKDIMRFHAIIWPAILMALDLPLPKHLAVHGWITFNGEKMSKSLGNVVDPFVLGERYGCDAIRYHILREMALGADSSFSNEILINRINSDLANGFGNLVSRTVAMADKYFGGILPSDREADEIDEDFKAVVLNAFAETEKAMEETKIKQALEAIFKAVDRANKYIDETEPWKLGKDDSKKGRLASVLYNLLDGIRIISALLSPFMPTTMPKVWEQIGASEADVAYDKLSEFGVLPENVKVSKGEILFPRIDVEKEIEALNGIIKKNMESAQANLSSAEKGEVKADEKPEQEIELAPEICIDDFAKVEIRAAKVISAEKVKKSDKLLCLQLDDGMGGRQVVSGIAQYYAPEDLVGKTIQLIANLKPVKLRGVESFGMICAADTADGVKVIFLDDSIPAGAKIR